MLIAGFSTIESGVRLLRERAVLPFLHQKKVQLFGALLANAHYFYCPVMLP
jgi:hypothetical protein